MTTDILIIVLSIGILMNSVGIYWNSKSIKTLMDIIDLLRNNRML